jgi:hypothetical protein
MEVTTVRKRMIKSKVLLISTLTTVAMTGGLTAASPAAASTSGDAIMAAPNCSTLRNFSPWTYYTAWCGPKTAVWTQKYGAEATCQGPWGTYTAYGPIRDVPWTGKGLASTAQCDSGDTMISGWVHHY